MEYYISRNNSLCHFGIKGMKWGVRRYQDKNGRLTEAGKKRLSNYATDKDTSLIRKAYDSERSKIKDDDYLEQNRLINRFLRDYGKTLLNDLRLKDTNDAADDAYMVLRKLQLKRDIDNNPDIDDIKKSGYKIDYDSYDCIASKKIRGINVEISIANYRDGIARIVDKPSDVIKTTESFLGERYDSNIRDISSQVYKEIGQYLTGRDGQVGKTSEASFRQRIKKPYYMSVMQTEDNRKICTMGFDDDDMLGGHSIDVSCDISNNKVRDVSMNG